MSRKSGRVRCGYCERILEDAARRTPTDIERAQIAAADTGVGAGALMYEFGGPRDRRTHQGPQVDGQFWTCTCKCGRKFRISNNALAQRNLEARDRGEDLYLGRTDLIGVADSNRRPDVP